MFRLGSISVLAITILSCGRSSVSEFNLQRTPPTVWEESNKSYEVRFTNPKCRTYHYAAAQGVKKRSGGALKHAPKNAWCKNSKNDTADAKSSAAQANSPQRKLLEMVKDPSTKHIFLAFLSFKHPVVVDALCQEAKKRNYKIDIVMDNPFKYSKIDKITDPVAKAKAIKKAESKIRVAKRLATKCKNQRTGKNNVKLHLRGHEKGIKFAHIKLVIANPNATKMRIAFGSANLSAGVMLHHENWHFLTIPTKTYFAQTHLCLMNSMIKNGHSRRDFAEAMSDCREDLVTNQGLVEESDVKTFFVPASRKINGKLVRDGNLGLEAIDKVMAKSDSIDLAAHRLLLPFDNLKTGLANGKIKKLRVVVDDDMYWAGRGQRRLNQSREYRHMLSILKSDPNATDVRYIQTNHGSHLLHHNKFLVFYKSGKPKTVWAGAGNFTKAAFKHNYENYYLITTPAVVRSFAKQMDYFWNTIGTKTSDMPNKPVTPAGKITP